MNIETLRQMRAWLQERHAREMKVADEFIAMMLGEKVILAAPPEDPHPGPLGLAHRKPLPSDGRGGTVSPPCEKSGLAGVALINAALQSYAGAVFTGAQLREKVRKMNPKEGDKAVIGVSAALKRRVSAGTLCRHVRGDGAVEYEGTGSPLKNSAPLDRLKPNRQGKIAEAMREIIPTLAMPFARLALAEAVIARYPQFSARVGGGAVATNLTDMTARGELVRTGFGAGALYRLPNLKAAVAAARGELSRAEQNYQAIRQTIQVPRDLDAETGILTEGNEGNEEL